MTYEIPVNVARLMNVLHLKGYEAVVIGGAARDLYLQQIPKDWDIFTDANGNQILELFPEGKVIGGEERQAKILTVVVDGVEISQFRTNGDRTQTGKSLSKHIRTCDFTINAMIINRDGTLVDVTNGQQDLDDGEFGYIGEPQDRIKEDPLRILRAVRFMVKLGLSFRHMGTFKEYGHLIETLPKERIRDEFMKIIAYDGGLERLISTGLIKYIMPKFLENVGVNGGGYHDETVDAHILFAFNNARKISDDPKLWLAVLLHDIAKGETFTEQDIALLVDPPIYKKEIHFFGHEDVGAKYAEQWMTEMGFANHERQFVVCLVKNHMWQFSETYAKRSFINHFREFEDNGVGITDFVALKFCDHQGNQANPRVKYADFVKKSPLIKKYYELKFTKEPFKVQDLLIKGQDLMAMGMKQGPGIGSLLNEAFNEVLDGNLANDRATLMLWAKVRVKQFLIGEK